MLRRMVEAYPYTTEGANAVDWKAVAVEVGRTTKQCRERWINVLDPGILHTKWSEAELETLFRAHAELGNKWSAIAQRIPGRCVACALRWSGGRKLGLQMRSLGALCRNCALPVAYPPPNLCADRRLP